GCSEHSKADQQEEEEEVSGGEEGAEFELIDCSELTD
ncbi:hypothetical protein Tco_0936574, partial [Tanacetum coccineum]